MRRELTVVTYNIRHGLGMDGRTDLPRIAEVLNALTPDIVFLQEVENRSPRTKFQHQARTLATRAGMDATCYGANLRLGPWLQFGNAIIARGANYSTWNNFALPSSGEARGLLYCRAKIGTTPLHLFCTHWGLDSAQRQRQAEECARIIRDAVAGEPAILCGDLNAGPASPEVGQLIKSSGLINAAAGEQPLTYPSDRPAAAIDYIFCSDHFDFAELLAVPSLASDHLPLEVLLTLR